MLALPLPGMPACLTACLRAGLSPGDRAAPRAKTSVLARLINRRAAFALGPRQHVLLDLNISQMYKKKEGGGRV